MLRRNITPKPAGFALLIPRRGFTILEMILALSIGLLILGCFYSVLSYQAQQAQSGRHILQEATLSRSIFTSMTKDILDTLGPVNSFVWPGNASTTTSSSTTTTTSTSTAAATPVDTSNTIIFNNMVYGAGNYLVLTSSKVPRELNLTGVQGKVDSADPTMQASVSDLRRISYWMDSRGLAYQEVRVATSNDINTVPPTLSEPESKLLASEVKEIAFQYWDGVGWQDSWDGSTLGGPNSNVPIGPPSAISITITFYRRAPDNSELPDEQAKYTHVVFIPCGNNFPQTSNQ